MKEKQKKLWIGKALYALQRYSLASDSTHQKVSAAKVSIVLWLWENKDEIPSSIAKVLEKVKESGTKKVSRSPLLYTFKGLRENEALIKGDDSYTLDYDIAPEDSKMFLWTAKALLAIVEYGKDKGGAYQIGGAKINFIYWLWENKNKLPHNTRKMAYDAGITSDEDETSTTVTTTIEALIEHGAMKKDEKKYKII